jgi:hypothetical protein
MVVDVLLGLLDAHPGLHWSADSGWSRTVPSAEQNLFTNADWPLFATKGSA